MRKNNQEQLEKLRHSLAHIMMQALENLYKAVPAIGPAIEDGFYHDFDSEQKITEADLKKIKKEMFKIISKDFPIEKITMSIDEGIKLLKEKNYVYTLELAEELKEKREKEITFYKQGDFINMCKGPHLKSTGEVNMEAFKLTKIAGAYWRNDENNKMLSRIYGVAFETPEELENYKLMLVEAEKRDHRKLGKELDLFTFSDLIGPGLPLFTPKGTLIRDLIIDKIQKIQKVYGYQRVDIPHITKSDLYKKSGHWEKFGDELFKVKGKSETEFVIKPMSCPHHTQIYASKPVSYKDLPIRYVETTKVYRDEQAGELIGLARVRSITQDDGHVFCSPDQIEEEVGNIVNVIKEFYQSLDMFKEGDFWVSLSVRDSKDLGKYLGDEKLWDKAESTLEKIAKKEKLPYKRVEGEAAFYGPKLDFMFKDALGRERQLATAQLDFIMPERFELEYTDKDGLKKTPVMIHRAIAGSLERFIAVMIEHFAGAFPLWLSPVQIRVLPITDAHKEYAKEIFEILKEKDFRVELDDDNENLGKKIRKSKVEKIPYFLVIGDEEIKTKTITVESRDQGNLGQMSIEDFLKKLEKEGK
ncbi:threonine--tRNA ligase [Candidatus Campbellbacteria bacterium RIFOXYC2_FULL_35_25]|uniref:Threonine--tRNA ligase n=1 Tax=Candidatus Campbellbacteria bacterium RIFOXYC2_FULL_35_25 TaxID=1797582 RepID=A0A1F5EKG0_9BACT|nr:MAG: threonine--tRNA ligase [Candidatus Campbellbacteria bacterium RIFOXYC2_FULL_35_25]